MTIDAPRLPKPQSLPTTSIDHLQHDETYADMRWHRQELIAQAAEYPAFSRLRMEGVQLTATQLTAPKLTDVHLSGCDLANAAWPRAIVHRTEFAGCRLVGFQALESHFQNVVLRDCLAALARWRFASFKQVRFETCDLSGADFQGADLSGVVFARCNLTNVEMSGATLVGTDFRGSDLTDLRVGTAEVPGAIVDHAQAAYMASLLGLVIKSEGE